jgi:hypothetical protein
MALPGRILAKRQLGRCRFLAALAAIMVMDLLAAPLGACVNVQLVRLYHRK